MTNVRKRSTLLALGASLSAATLLVSTVGAASAAPIEDVAPALLYTFENEEIADSSGNGLHGELVGTGATFTDEGLHLPGGSSSSGAASVKVPTQVFEGEETVSVSMWLQNETGDDNYAAAYVGGTSQNNGYWLFNPSNPSGQVKSVITKATAASPSSNPWSTEIGGTNPGRASTDEMTHYTTVIDSENGLFSVYVNGVLVSEDEIETNLTDFGTLRADIGRSAYPDRFFKGTIKEYRVDHAALSPQQVSELFVQGGGDLDALTQSAIEALDLPETASRDFDLPHMSQGVQVAWEVTEGDAIEVDGHRASVTVPSPEDGAATVTLRASLVSGDLVLDTRDFEISVLDPLSADIADLEIVSADDIRTNFSVPSKGVHGADLEWSVVSGPIELVEDTDALQTVAVERPAPGAEPAAASLEVVVSLGNLSETLTFDVTITPLPEEDEEMEAYFWAFFTGEGQGAEKISFAASQGNDALSWNTLNDGQPVLESTLGKQGLRDPFIIRSNEGDKFYMLATDLKIAGLPGGFDTAQRSGSLYLEIWESTDLVNWGKQRHVQVSSPYAGNTWAPEAFFDDETGKYVVYWASNLYEDTDVENRDSVTYNRMMYALTEDFVHFSEPEIWIDVDQGKGKGVIDVTSAKEDGWYYRVYKDESDMTLRQEKSKTFLATHNGEAQLPDTHDDENRWSLITDKFASGLPNGAGGTFHQGEGPSIFPSNPNDVNGFKWFVWIDQPGYHDGPNHYVPFATDKTLAETGKNDWVSVADQLINNLPQNADGGKPRHGTVIPVTRSEYQGILENYQPDLAVVSAESIAVETEVNSAPEMPSDIELTMADGQTITANVTWDSINFDQLAEPGTVVLSGTAQDASRFPVEAVITVNPADESGDGDDEDGSDEDGSGEDGSDQEGSDQDGSDENGSDETGSDENGADQGGADQDGEADNGATDGDTTDGETVDADKKDPDTLPRTGASTLLLMGVALLLAALGIGLARVSKRDVL